MPSLLADFIYSRDCKLNLRKNVDTTIHEERIVFSALHSVNSLFHLPNKKHIFPPYILNAIKRLE